MSSFSTLSCLTVALVVSGCIMRPAATTAPSAATIALYDMNASHPEAPVSSLARRDVNGSSSGVTPIGDFVRTRSAQLQFCYAESRAANPNLAGAVTIGVLLAPDGSVTRADVLRRSWDGRVAADVESCALSKVRAWKFPPSDAAATRPYSFSAVFTR